MKLVFFGLLAYMVGWVSAYGSYGAYERMFFYYAYLIDADLNDGKPQKIARGCRSKRGGGQCSFNEFIEYISEIKGGTPSITTSPRPVVDATADLLVQGGYTGAYNQDKISAGVGTGSGTIPKLFDQVSAFIGGNLEGGKLESAKENLGAARVAMQRVQFLRSYENSKALKAWLEGRGVTVSTKTKILNDGKNEQYEFVDVSTTDRKNGGSGVAGLVENFYNQDPSHRNNVVSSFNSLAKIGGCTRKGG
ncbi:MAG: hypothetical protein M1816_003794 [Peltula sp. TS41687]|nr:MAG: hypothetical protein M1816_003794 [Peltula sp. TS41687]